MSLLPDLPASIIEIRNSLQQCPLVDHKREGLGIIITDDADIIIGQLHQGKLHGWYAYLTENSQAYGFMVAGELQGFNVVQVDQNLTVCGIFEKNLVTDICLVTSADKYQIAKFKNGYRQQILEKGSYNRQTVYDIIKKHFNSQIIGLRKFMSYQLQLDESNTISEIEINSMYRYYGFVNAERIYGEGLGLVFKNDLLYNFGVYKATELSGLGRLYIKDEIQDGVFVAGVLEGEGITYDYNSNQYVCGNFSSQQNNFERGYGFPTRPIKQLRKQHHLRSIDFFNDVVVIDRIIKIKIGDIMPQFVAPQDVEVQSLYGRSNAPTRKEITKSPSPSARSIHSTRPTKYYISDNSPLKRMLRQYEKQSDRLTPEKRNSHENPASKSPISNKPDYSRRVMDDEPTTSVRSRPPVIPRKQIYQREPIKNEQDSLVVKDTFEMIRHMEEIEKSKRDDLARLHGDRIGRTGRR